MATDTYACTFASESAFGRVGKEYRTTFYGGKRAISQRLRTAAKHDRIVSS